MPDDPKETRVDRTIKVIKNNRWLYLPILAGIAVIALAKLTNAIQIIEDFLYPPDKPEMVAEYCIVVAPLVAQLDRTKEAIENRWTAGNEALELTTVRDANLKARELLTKHVGLVTSELEEHRKQLVNHYDEWLEEFYSNRVQTERGAQKPYTFVHSFPRDSEAPFRARYKALREELGDSIACG